MCQMKDGHDKSRSVAASSPLDVAGHQGRLLAVTSNTVTIRRGSVCLFGGKGGCGHHGLAVIVSAPVSVCLSAPAPLELAAGKTCFRLVILGQVHMASRVSPMNDPDATGPFQFQPDSTPPLGDHVPSGHPTFIGRFRIERLLGEGGFGRVYLARDEQLLRAVAIKVPNRQRLSADKAAAYLAEAQIAAGLDHPHIVPVYEVGQTADGLCFIVSKLIEGSDLATRIRDERPSYIEAATWIASVADALHFAHQKGLVHRDVKSQNILIDTNGKAFVVDFGLAFKDDDVGKGASFAGTPGYMSPEVARRDGQRVDSRSDIFSLGVVLYEVLVGQRPFQGRQLPEILEQIVQVEVRPPRQVIDAIPQELERICLKALAKRTSERYTTAKDMADDLREFLKQPPAGAAQRVTDIVKVVPVRKASTRRWSLAIGAMVMALLATAIIWQMRPGAEQDKAALQHELQDRTLDATKGKGGSGRPSEEGPLAGLPKPGSPPQVGKPPQALTKTGSKGPIKVFILAGQSDMAGRGKISTLDWLGQDPKHAHLLRKIKNPDGSWVVRDDVWVDHRVVLPEKTLREERGSLTVGYGQTKDEIGPELLFGHVMGDLYENQVLIIKITQGPMCLAIEARPPGSGGETGLFYKTMLATVQGVLANLKTNFPAYHDQGYEIAGFIWFQGWNDMTIRGVDEATRFQEYEKNLANLIKDVRKDLGLPRLPVVIGELGVGGAAPNGSAILRMRQAQAAVAARLEFQGNVILVKTSECWDNKADALMLKGFSMKTFKWTDDEAKQEFDKMGSSLPYMYLGSGKIYALIGEAFGEATKKLCANPVK